MHKQNYQKLRFYESANEFSIVFNKTEHQNDRKNSGDNRLPLLTTLFYADVF